MSLLMLLEATRRLKAKSPTTKVRILFVVCIVIYFRPYLYDIRFIIYTNHRPLKCLITNDKLIRKLARWVLIWEDYEFKVIHRPDVTNQNTDIISRFTLTTLEDILDARQDF